jgi:hypothetical protein
MHVHGDLYGHRDALRLDLQLGLRELELHHPLVHVVLNARG